MAKHREVKALAMCHVEEGTEAIVQDADKEVDNAGSIGGAHGTGHDMKLNKADE